MKEQVGKFRLRGSSMVSFSEHTSAPHSMSADDYGYEAMNYSSSDKY